MRLFGNARMSARARQLINKRDRTAEEDAEAQQLLVAYMDTCREREERARQWRRRRDKILIPLDTAFGTVIWPVAALWNTMMLCLHDLLTAIGKRLRRGRRER